MKIGICGNSDLIGLAAAIDTLRPEYEIVTGDPQHWEHELHNIPQDFVDSDFFVLALDWMSCVPAIYDYTWGDNFDATLLAFTTFCRSLTGTLEQLKQKSPCKLLLYTPPTPVSFPTGFITRLLDNSQLQLFVSIQNIFNDVCKSVTDCYPVDTDFIEHSDYSASSHDKNGHQALPAVKIAGHCVRMIDQFVKYPLKCIILDLDNTLWGGVVGESELSLLVLDSQGDGKPYFEFQKELLKIHKQGILLAICSKNNTCDALEIIEAHPHMVLRPSMIAAFRINWDNKTLNILSIAKELNIGLESIMFIDDNPSERGLVKETLPDVEVLDLPEDPREYVETLRSCSRFWPIQLTKDDLKKNTYFSMDRLRKKSRNIETNIADFLRKSGLTVTISQTDKESMPRVVQLINKTNQFNLTTKRFTHSELEMLLKEPETYLLHMEMRDTFGEYGIIGVSLIRNSVIELLLLSCRVLGKDVEIAFLSVILHFMKDHGIRNATGLYIPSEKNIQTVSFYKNC
ncbi:MAG TPA: HAD-IIIC family phosphatase, partial [Chitinispirillaceae bacterium]|nr:HAD-IIIC family phosphatase [Chitinispirillaceae bacterium]